MRITRRLITLLLAALGASLPAGAVDTPATVQWLVTSAKATGAKGENFVSSLRLVNGTAASATVGITFYPRVNFNRTAGEAPGDNTAAALTTTVTVPAGQTLGIDDALFTLFGITSTSASGGLQIESKNFVPISVLSQTLVTNARAADGTPGTYGFAIPAQIPDNAVAEGDTGYVPYLSSSPTAAQGYRSNLFLQTTNADGDTVVNVKLLKGADGSTIGARDVTLGKLVQTQINQIADFFGYGEANTNLTAVITVKSGGPVFVGASVNDNATGSQVYAPPTKKWSPRDASFALLLGDGGYGFTGRLDIPSDGVPDYMTALVVIENCGGNVQPFIVQASPLSPFSNTTFTVNADGSISFTGGEADATWEGTIIVDVDGMVRGNLKYTRASGSAGAPCPAATVTTPFYGRKVLAYGLV